MKRGALGAWLMAAWLAGCTEGVILNPLRPRLVADRTSLRLGPAEVGVPVTGSASLSNPSDGETHLQAYLSGGEGTLELLDTSGTATIDQPGIIRVRFLPVGPAAHV